MPIALPTIPGSYRVYFGQYRPETQERLPVDAPDFRPLIGEITIRS